jgi:hypothetical protein
VRAAATALPPTQRPLTPRWFDPAPQLLLLGEGSPNTALRQLQAAEKWNLRPRSGFAPAGADTPGSRVRYPRALRTHAGSIPCDDALACWAALAAAAQRSAVLDVRATHGWSLC